MAQAGWMSRHAARATQPATKWWTGGGIPSMGFHQARHTYISWLVASGLDIRSVKEYAGHESITTTQRYMKLYPGHERRSVDRLDAFWSHDRDNFLATPAHTPRKR